MDTTTSIVEALERAPAVVIPLVREVPTDVLKRRPSPRKWSAHEHACHLALVHWMFFDRLDVNAIDVVHSGDSGNNGGYHTNPVLLEGLPNEISW